jgi:phage terminase large subunit-like protein
MAGYKQELETEMLAMTDHGWTGEGRSPNRVDAMVWMVHEMFPHLTRAEKKAEAKRERRVVQPTRGGGAWMG